MCIEDIEEQFDTTPFSLNETCMKIPYETYELAKAATHVHKTKVRPYYCDVCDKYHLTSLFFPRK